MSVQFSEEYPGSLFWNGSLLELIQSQVRNLCAEIEGCGRDFVLGCKLEEVADSLMRKYALEPVRLHREKVEMVEHGQTTINPEKRTCLIFYDPNVARTSVATFYRFTVPFEGDHRLLMRRPSDYETELPWGEVVGSELHITCKTTSRDAGLIRSHIDDNLNRIERWLTRANREVAPFNTGLMSTALHPLQARRHKLQQDHAIAEAVGFPIRSRAGAPDAYRVPVQRKKLPELSVKTSGRAAPPDPHLDWTAYEGILDTIGSMVRVLELSPKAFAKMDEESMRFMLLVPLNIHYEGQATGETFNYDGKTDIIIKVGGRNIFVAECLIWDGPEYFRSKIEQLLGYTSWRDNKTAIIIFNRNKNLSAVLAQIPDLVRRHSNFKREIAGYKNETGFRFALHHRDDKNREFTLTVLVFDVPSG